MLSNQKDSENYISQYVGLNIIGGNEKEIKNLEYVLDENQKGLYVCVLKDNSGNCHHSIGVDCNKKVIYDSLNEQSSKLTHDNLIYVRDKIMV